MIRWNYELVNNFVKENSQCELLSAEFKKAKEKMLFKCICNEEFETTFEKFKNRNKRQCTNCGLKTMKDKQSFNLEFVKDYVEKFSKCKLLSKEYINTKSSLKFKCHCGDLFEKSFQKFKSTEKQCKKCSYLDISKKQTFSYEFVKNYIESKNCKLLDESYTNCEIKMKIVCFCGEEFDVKFNSFKNENQIRCRKCTNQMSKGEILIDEYLKNNKFKYETQYYFEDLKAKNNKHYLKFDFAVFDGDNIITLIEFDGMQHSKPVEFYGGSEAFEVLKNNDKMKNDFCSNKNIHLLRIEYKNLNNINEILNNYFHSMTIPCQA